MSTEDMSPDHIQQDLHTYEKDLKYQRPARVVYVVGYILSHLYAVDARDYVPFKKFNPDANPDE